MVGAAVETYCDDEGRGLRWHNRLEGGTPLPGDFGTQEAAVEVARDEARIRGVEHIILRADGSVADRRRYPRTSWELPM